MFTSTQTDVLSTSQTEVCVKTYDSSRGLSSGASSPFVKSRMDSVSLHCARQNGLSGAWQREGFFFCSVGFGSGAVHSTASAARCLPARCYSNRTRPASENNLVLNENLLCANGGKIGGGSGREKGEKKGRKEGMRRLDLAYLSCTSKAY